MPKGIYKHHKLSEEHKRKISLNHRRHQTEETKRKISLMRKGRKTGIIPKTAFKKGMTPWNKGLKPAYMQGENHPLWKGGITTSNDKERAKFRRTIQKQVFERDDYTCQLCGERGVALQVDHIQSWAEYVEGRFLMDNCRTLCQKCHYQITFGKLMPESVKTWGHNLKQIEKGVI